MIGIFEIIFIIVAFCVMWFLMFKVKLMYDKKKEITNLPSNIEKQEGRDFLIEGRIVKMDGKKPEKKKPEDKPKDEPVKKPIKKANKKVAKKPIKRKK